MENATKALLIAAAILIAIILISLGIAVVQKGSNALEQADLSDTEKQSYNMKWQNYESSNASVTEVNNLLATVLNHNVNEKAEGTNRYITASGGSITTVNNSSKSYVKVTGSDHYTIKCELDEKTGLVNKITITKK